MPSIAEIWDFIGIPFGACVLIGLILGYLGTHVLRREVIFIDIALAQFAAVGATIAHFVFTAQDHGHHHHGHGEGGGEMLELVCSFCAVFVAAIFYSVVRKKVTQISLEAVIGVTYAIAFAAALFIPGVAGAGHVDVKEMLFGDLFALSAWSDLSTLFFAFVVVAFCCFLFRKPLNRISSNYHSAGERGMRVVLWDVVFYTIMGVVITLSVRIVGVVMVFVYLVFPATIAALVTRKTVLQLPILACTVLLASAIGLGFSAVEETGNFSMGPPIGVCMGLMLILTAVGKRVFCLFFR